MYVKINGNYFKNGKNIVIRRRGEISVIMKLPGRVNLPDTRMILRG